MGFYFSYCEMNADPYLHNRLTFEVNEIGEVEDVLNLKGVFLKSKQSESYYKKNYLLRLLLNAILVNQQQSQTDDRKLGLAIEQNIYMVALASIDFRAAEETLFSFLTIGKSVLSQELADNLIELLILSRNTDERELAAMYSGLQNHDSHTVQSLQEFKQRVKKSEDRLRVWLFLNGFRVDESRIFYPNPDNMYPIKFLSDLVDSRITYLIENPLD